MVSFLESIYIDSITVILIVTYTIILGLGQPASFSRADTMKSALKRDVGLVGELLTLDQLQA